MTYIIVRPPLYVLLINHEADNLQKNHQVLFILLIFLMPVLDILRYDTATKELIVFGQSWSLGLKEGFYADPSASGAFHIAVQFFLKAILPWLLSLQYFLCSAISQAGYSADGSALKGHCLNLPIILHLKLTGRRSLYSKSPNDPDAGKTGKFIYGAF